MYISSTHSRTPPRAAEECGLTGDVGDVDDRGVAGEGGA